MSLENIEINVLCPECGTSNDTNSLVCKECSNELVLNDKYYLLEILGENIGTTYLARDLNNQNVIIKELSLRRVDKWKTQELFQREGDILSQLNSPFIPKFIDEFQTGIARSAKSYLVIENVDGINLREEFKNKRYTEAEISQIAIDIATILDYLHNLMPPVIHRDIKLSNIMRKSDGSLALIDFGSVKDVMRDKNATISGTIGFMAPEQLMGKPVIASDFYSLGTTLLVLLSRKEIEEMLENGIDLNWKSSVHVSNKMTHLLERLLDKNPEKRLNSLEELKEILLTDKYNKKELVKSNKTESKIVEKKELTPLEFLANQDNSYLENLDRFDPNDTNYYNNAYAYDINKVKLISFSILVALGIILLFAFISNSLGNSYNDDDYNSEYQDDTYDSEISEIYKKALKDPNQILNPKESDNPIKKLPKEGTHGYLKKIKTNTP